MTNTSHIVIFVGVCGTGKSRLARTIAKTLTIPFFDADTFRASGYLVDGTLPQETNLDEWLLELETLIQKQLSQQGCVISCSLLKKEHRKMLTANIDHDIDWIFMNDSIDKVVQRAVAIEEHTTRSTEQIKSDFEELEAPQRALTVDMRHSQQEILDTILEYLSRKYG